MSVDKFGRFNSLGAKIQQGPPGPPGQQGPGFFITSSGDYNVQGKRLFNLKDAVENKDAVTKIYVDSEIKKVIDANKDLKNSFNILNTQFERTYKLINESNRKLIESVSEYMDVNLDLIYKKMCELNGKKVVMRTRSPWAPSLPGLD